MTVENKNRWVQFAQLFSGTTLIGLFTIFLNGQYQQRQLDQAEVELLT